MISVTLLLLLCAIVALVVHVLKPSVPLWIAVLFLIVAILVTAIPVR